MKIKKKREWLQQALFVFPGLLIFLTIVIVPFLMGFYYSFTKWDGIRYSPSWTGLSNFWMLMEDTRFWHAFGYTIKFTVIAVVITNLMAFSFAVLLIQRLKMRNILRTIFFLPNVIGGLLLGYIWQFIFVKGFTTIGSKTHIAFFQEPWLGTPTTGFWGTIIVFIWQTTGYMMIVYIAALVSVPKDLQEAARIDGAGAWQMLRSVTLPLVMPAVTICLFLTTSGAFKMFDLNLSLTNGGPGTSTESLALNIYREAFTNSNFGLGTMKAMMFFVAVAIVTVTQVLITKKREVQA
ncbi:raffinose/stachyose/melibiose transport system permease protein [Paenibacillus sp. UNCCL117]|uniref:carbohydrate ABC transporter permease n=1 Tax=unclassified Paenibacillus TaxID=185978 RepID=UPI000887BD40|nr:MULTISPECIES: sugar ABC transporter permease [unclassified Paenibacillus]SDC26653.1 carbohydrate ABC transporter membrane protein 1, CUT1 family [Paenibacillus sp. cl123]SFW20146.1 raffinose/stachyose/melibiose transport system permease protein [Paenibacillus sp. UNCCL117]